MGQPAGHHAHRLASPAWPRQSVCTWFVWVIMPIGLPGWPGPRLITTEQSSSLGTASLPAANSSHCSLGMSIG